MTHESHDTVHLTDWCR